MTKLIFFPTFLLLATLATAQIPGPDSTFGRFGAAWRNIYPTDDQAFAVALRPDGRAVVAGRTTIDSVPQMAVFQYKTDGTLDLDFHWNGKGALTYNTLSSAAHAVTIDAEGRVLLTGYITTPNGEDFALVRLLANGAQDPTFGNGNGWATTDFSSGNDQANAIALQPDGKIVVAGFTRKGADADFALARYLPDGSLDPTFGTGGQTVTKIDTLADIIRGMAIQTNGRIVVCGTSVDPLGFNYPAYFSTARYTIDGKLDPVFGGTGVLRYDVGADEENDIARAVTLSPSGQIVVAGYSSVALSSKISVVRYRPNGLLDTSFGNLGVVQTSVVPTYGNFCTGLAVLPDNSLLLSGMAENVDFKDVFLLKMLENGTPDPAFGQSGKIIRSLSSKDDNAYGITRRPDGRILVVGDTRKDGDFYTDAAVLQFNANGSNDATFGNGGAVVEDLGTSEDFGSAVLVQPDGKVLVGGSAGNETAKKNWTLLRYLPNGQPDNIFGSGSALTYAFSGGINVLESLLRLPDGKILAAGTIESKPVLVRFGADGTLDASFGTGGKLVINPAVNSGSCKRAILLTSGKVLAVTNETINGNVQSVLRRFSPDGQLDPAFGVSGAVISSDYGWVDVAEMAGGQLVVANTLHPGPPTPSFSEVIYFTANGVQYDKATSASGFVAYRLIAHPNNKVLMAGYDLGSFGAVRFSSSGNADVTFNGTGNVKFPQAYPCGFSDALVQKDGRILLIGTEHIANPTGETVGFVIARLNSDGSRDNSWGQSGFLKLRGTEAHSAAFDADGNILAVGSIHNGERSDIVVYRLLRGEYVGIADRPDEAGSRILNVFPNPVSEQLTLEYDLIDNQEVEVKMYDMEGRLIHTLLSGEARFSGKNTERLTLPTSLPAGMYTVAVETKRGSVAVQVVVR